MQQSRCLNMLLCIILSFAAYYPLTRILKEAKDMGFNKQSDPYGIKLKLMTCPDVISIGYLPKLYLKGRDYHSQTKLEQLEQLECTFEHSILNLGFFWRGQPETLEELCIVMNEWALDKNSRAEDISHMRHRCSVIVLLAKNGGILNEPVTALLATV